MTTICENKTVVSQVAQNRALDIPLREIEEMRTILARERSLADRAETRLAMIVLNLGEQLRSREEMICYLQQIVKRTRLSDIIGWLNENCIGIIMPDGSATEGLELAQQIERFQPIGQPHLLSCVFEYPTSWHLGESTSRSLPDSEVPVVAMESLFVQGVSVWKRMLDIAGSIVGMLLLIPLFALVTVAIKFTSRGPVLFTQLRRGHGGKPFKMFKFRSMVIDAEDKKPELLKQNEQDGPAFKMEHDPRVTQLGQFLRKSSIDELPQLWNVLMGDMSLVGPRPLPCDEMDACLRWQRRRLEVVPGLTCIWQVEARNQVSFQEWVRMDMRYLQKRSLWFDLKLLLATIPAVLFCRGAR